MVCNGCEFYTKRIAFALHFQIAQFQQYIARSDGVELEDEHTLSEYHIPPRSCLSLGVHSLRDLSKVSNAGFSDVPMPQREETGFEDSFLLANFAS